MEHEPGATVRDLFGAAARPIIFSHDDRGCAVVTYVIGWSSHREDCNP